MFNKHSKLDSFVYCITIGVAMGVHWVHVHPREGTKMGGLI